VTVETLRDLHGARPFRPFRLSLADGRSVQVKHPEVLGVSPGGRTLHLFFDDEHSEYIDLLHVTSIEFGNGRTRRRRR